MCERKCANCICWVRDTDHEHPMVKLRTGECTLEEIGVVYDDFWQESISVFKQTDEDYVCPEHEFEEHIVIPRSFSSDHSYGVKNILVHDDFSRYVIPQRRVD